MEKETHSIDKNLKEEIYRAALKKWLDSLLSAYPDWKYVKARLKTIRDQLLLKRNPMLALFRQFAKPIDGQYRACVGIAGPDNWAFYELFLTYLSLEFPAITKCEMVVRFYTHLRNMQERKESPVRVVNISQETIEKLAKLMSQDVDTCNVDRWLLFEGPKKVDKVVKAYIQFYLDAAKQQGNMDKEKLEAIEKDFAQVIRERVNAFPDISRY